MREELLHFIWKRQGFSTINLCTTTAEPLLVIAPGAYNEASGPDFFNARVTIAGLAWAGNVEVHLSASDWYAHRHEADAAYDNVVLHVVWEDDVAVFRKDGSQIPTLALKDRVADSLLSYYHNLLQAPRTFINCEKDLAALPQMLVHQWQQRLFVERLEKKSAVVLALLKTTKNDWEAVLFYLLMKNFGLNKNGASFLAIAKHIGYKVVKKVADDPLALESLFLGTAGILDQEEIVDAHFLQLKDTYAYLKAKFQLGDYIGERPVFFGLRPSNFPTIRLSQLASLYSAYPNLFARLMAVENLKDYQDIFNIAVTAYWQDHYTFGKTSKSTKKVLSKGFVQLLLVNTVVPLRFCYAKQRAKDQSGVLMDLLHQLPPEKNSIITAFKAHGLPSTSAFESQAKIQLYKAYCTKNRCLHCQFGGYLLANQEGANVR